MYANPCGLYQARQCQWQLQKWSGQALLIVSKPCCQAVAVAALCVLINLCMQAMTTLDFGPSQLEGWKDNTSLPCIRDAGSNNLIPAAASAER